MGEVLVVGAGPTGSWVSYKLAGKGWKVEILEEHEKVGYPWCCAGVVGISGMNELGLQVPKEVILETLRGAILHLPSGRSVEFTRGKDEAWVLDRPLFDDFLCGLAVGAGVIPHLGCKCTKVAGERLLAGGREFHGKVIVGADGPNSLVGRESGLIRERKFLRLAQVEVRTEVVPGFAEIFLGREVSPVFFGWLVPAGEEARLGVGTTGDPMPYLKNLMRKVRGKPTSRPRMDVLPLNPPKHLCTKNVVLVGDAAGQLKPVTKGGIYFGLAGAQLAAEAISSYLEGRGKLETYEREFRKKFGVELRLGGMISTVFSILPDVFLEMGLSVLEKEPIRGRFLSTFDFDHHARSLLRFLRGKGF